MLELAITGFGQDHCANAVFVGNHKTCRDTFLKALGMQAVAALPSLTIVETDGES
jgi:hypothetical protein